MSARRLRLCLLWLASFTACVAPPDTLPMSRAQAQTAALAGEPGPAGVAGPSGVFAASELIASNDGVLSLVSPAECGEDQTLVASGGRFSCESDELVVNRLVAGPGFSSSGDAGAVTLGVRYGGGDADVSRTVHDHLGDTFSGNLTRSIVTVDNQKNTTPSRGVFAENDAPGDISSQPATTVAAVVGRNKAPANGYGVIGNSVYDAFAAEDNSRQGVAGFAGGLGSRATVGIASGANAVGLKGEATSSDAVGIVAQTAGYALKTVGKVDMGSGGVILPFVRWTITSAGTWAEAACDPGSLAVSGGCTSASAITFMQMTGPDSDCSAAAMGNPISSYNGVSGFDGFCCHIGAAGTVTAYVQCLKVGP